MTDKEKIEAIKAEIHRLVDVRGYDREMANDLFAFMNSLPNEPVNEDLQTEIEDYINRNFSEGSDGCLITDKNKSLGGVTYSEICELARHFSKWQKQQMIKDAISAEVRTVEDFMGTTTFRCVCDKYKVGEKVKLIIIKED